MQDAKLMLELIRSELSGKPFDTTLLPTDDPEQLLRLYDLSKRHDMAHILASVLHHNGLLCDDELSKKYTKNMFTAVMRHEQILSEQESICRLFEEEAIDYLPLKGAVIRNFYPQPWTRTSCDVDILVREADLARAAEALETRLSYGGREDGFHNLTYYAPSGVHLELHFSILVNHPKADRLLKDVWDYAEREREGSHRFRLSDDFLFFHILAHTCAHFIDGGCGVKAFADLWILRRREEYDPDKVNRLLEICGLETFARHALRLSEVWFSGAPHDEITLAMEEYVLNGGVYGTRKQAVAVQQNKKGGRMQYLFRRLFLPYDQLKVSFHNPDIKRWQVPYYTVKRWFRLMKRSTFAKVKDEVSLSGGLSQDELNRTGDLMKKLDL